MATVATAKKPRVALRFSNYFHINKKPLELAFVDILLDTDIRLHINPFAQSAAWNSCSSEKTAWRGVPRSHRGASCWNCSGGGRRARNRESSGGRGVFHRRLSTDRVQTSSE